MNKQELIDKVVDEWLKIGADVRIMTSGKIVKVDKVTEDSGVSCNDFKDYCPTEIEPHGNGWCNGFKYGFEYQTNGKRPDLPDDCEYQVKFNARSELDSLHRTNKNWMTAWELVKSFKIVGERYRPVEQPNPNNSWHQKGEFPPVGERCEWGPHSPTKANWKSCTIDYIHGDRVCVTNDDSYKTKQVLHNVKFRPIKTDRERFVEAALSVNKMPLVNQAISKEWFGMLYDAGFKLPEVE